MYECMSSPFSEMYDIFEAENLSAEDRKLCLLAIERLKIAEYKRFKFLITWTHPTKCPESMDGTIGELAERETELAELVESEGTSLLMESPDVDNDHCSSACIASFEKKNRNSRLEAWESIPSIFKCLPWEQLSQLRQKTCSNTE